jgi:archaellum component FlaF (FlaF/FlaG flagellin family)
MAIFFAAFLTLFSFLYSSVNDAFDTVTGSFEDKYDDMSDRASTSFDFIDARYFKDDNRLDIRLRNSGGTALECNETELLVGGMLVSSATFAVDGGTSELWLPTDIMTISLDDPNLTFETGLDAREFASNDARLTTPKNISVGDEVYVIDGDEIDVFTLEGAFDYTISDPTNIVAPSDVKAYGDYLYVLDNGTHVDRFTPTGSWVDAFIADATNTPAPTAISVDEDYIYVLDGQNHLDRYDLSTGAFVDCLIANGGTMTAPVDVSVGAYVFVMDTSTGAYHIDRYALDGSGGQQIVGPYMLAAPTDLAASPAGLDTRFLYVANNSDEVLVFDEDGDYQDSVSEGLSDDVWGVDATGKIYVSDGANGLVIENLGTSMKVVTENGVSKVIQL